MTTGTTPRIDTLVVGSTVLLELSASGGPTYEEAIFLGVTGDGADREAKFGQVNPQGSFYTWEAYRTNGRWAYGTGADKLRLEAVLYTFDRNSWPTQH